jgi:hypothetical protein
MTMGEHRQQPSTTVPAPSSQGGGLLYAGQPFSLAELQAMAIDGLVVNIYGPAYVAAGEPVTSVHRALAAHAALPQPIRHKVVLGRLTAAWVYGCSPPGNKITVLLDHRYRATSQGRHRSIHLHEVALGPLDTLNISGVQITSPLRTALDIAVYARDEDAVRILLALSSDPRLKCPLGYIRQALQIRERMPGKNVALRRLAAALDLRKQQAGGTT